jgi:hypothetical protein
MNKQRLLITTIMGACTALTACLTPSAVDDFAKVSAQAATLFPAVAAIPYNSCVATAKNTQLANVTGFDGPFSFEQAAIAKACKGAQDTTERLTKTYAVLNAYVTALDKLAGGSAPTYDTNIKAAVANVPGLSSAQQTAATNLASLIADFVDKHYRQAEAAKAIHQAQPWVQELSVMLEKELPADTDELLKNELGSLVSLYRDAARSRIKNDPNKPPMDPLEVTNPILVTASFADKAAVIQQERDAVSSFTDIFDKLQKGHTALDEKRDKLFDKSTIQEFFQTVSGMKKDVDAVESAFKPSAAAASEK